VGRQHIGQQPADRVRLEIARDIADLQAPLRIAGVGVERRDGLQGLAMKLVPGLVRGQVVGGGALPLIGHAEEHVAVRHDVVRLELDRPAAGGERILGPAKGQERDRQIVVDQRLVRQERPRPFIGRDRVVELAHALQGDGHVGPGLSMVRLDLQDLKEGFKGGVVRVLRRFQIAQAEPGRGLTRIQLQRAAEGLLGLFRPPQGHQGDGAVAMGFGEVGSQGERLIQ